MSGFVINPYVFSGAAPPAFSPDDLTNLQLWLDASDATTITHDTGAVSAWADKSTNARSFEQTTGSLQPTTGAATLNSLNVLSFAGDYLTCTSAVGPFKFLSDGTSHTVFAVWKAGTTDDPNALNGLFGTHGGATASIGAAINADDRSGASRNDRMTHTIFNGSGSLVVANVSADDFFDSNVHAILTIRGDANASPVANRSFMSRNGGTEVNNNTQSASRSVSNETYALEIGAQGNGVTTLLGGEIAEIIMYDRALTSTEIDDVEEYLADKWGITL